VRPTLVVMVKEPRPGRVKTRLGRDIGMVPAAWWFRRQCHALLGRVTDPRWETVIAVSPDREGLASRIWPHHLQRVPQGGGDLGDRMGRLLRSLPPGPVLIIGADIPGIRRRHIARAFELLGHQDMVIGPAPDGGYWSIGLKRVSAVPASLFDDVRWSTENALEDTVASVSGLRIGILDTLSDVDTSRDL